MSEPMLWLSSHPGRRAIASWMDGDCDRVEWAEVARHCAACEDCKRESRLVLWLGAFSARAVASSTLNECFSAKTLERYIQGRLSPADSEVVRRHLETCEECQLEVEMLRVDDEAILPCV